METPADIRSTLPTPVGRDRRERPTAPAEPFGRYGPGTAGAHTASPDPV